MFVSLCMTFLGLGAGWDGMIKDLGRGGSANACALHSRLHLEDIDRRPARKAARDMIFLYKLMFAAQDQPQIGLLLCCT